MPDESDRADVVPTGTKGATRRTRLAALLLWDTDVFCPTLDISKDPSRAWRSCRDVSRLTEFLERCLAHPDRHEPRPEVPSGPSIPLGVYGRLESRDDGGLTWHES